MSSMHGNEIGWSVEARSSCAGYPIDCGDSLILTNEKWSPVSFTKAPVGVPSKSIFGIVELINLLTYEAAQALRWWFVAEMKQRHKQGIETRIVMHRIKYSVEATKVGADDPIGDIAYLHAGKAIEVAIAAQAGDGEQGGQHAS